MLPYPSEVTFDRKVKKERDSAMIALPGKSGNNLFQFYEWILPKVGPLK